MKSTLNSVRYSVLKRETIFGVVLLLSAFCETRGSFRMPGNVWWVMLSQGYGQTFFLQEQAGPLKQYDWGPSQKLRGPGYSRKLNSLQHHCQALALLLIEVGDQN